MHCDLQPAPHAKRSVKKLLAGLLLVTGSRRPCLPPPGCQRNPKSALGPTFPPGLALSDKPTPTPFRDASPACPACPAFRSSGFASVSRYAGRPTQELVRPAERCGSRPAVDREVRVPPSPGRASAAASPIAVADHPLSSPIRCPSSCSASELYLLASAAHSWLTNELGPASPLSPLLADSCRERKIKCGGEYVPPRDVSSRPMQPPSPPDGLCASIRL